MRWSCREIQDGWVMLAVDVYLADDNSPEAMAGLRYAVHPFQFDENPEAFWETVGEMQERARMVAEPLFASRARAFEITDEELAGLIQFRFGG